jgi:hypothetical protein
MKVMKKKSTKKQRANDGRPRRALNLYNIFFSMERKKILQQEAKPGFGGLAREVSDRWEKISPARKAELEELVRLDKIRFDNEMAEWKLKCKLEGGLKVKEDVKINMAPITEVVCRKGSSMTAEDANTFARELDEIKDMKSPKANTNTVFIPVVSMGSASTSDGGGNSLANSVYANDYSFISQVSVDTDDDDMEPLPYQYAPAFEVAYLQMNATHTEYQAPSNFGMNYSGEGAATNIMFGDRSSLLNSVPDCRNNMLDPSANRSPIASDTVFGRRNSMPTRVSPLAANIVFGRRSSMHNMGLHKQGSINFMDSTLFNHTEGQGFGMGVPALTQFNYSLMHADSEGLNEFLLDGDHEQHQPTIAQINNFFGLEDLSSEEM